MFEPADSCSPEPTLPADNIADAPFDTHGRHNDLSAAAAPVAQDPYPIDFQPRDPHEAPATHVHVEAGSGGASAILMDVELPKVEGNLSIVGVKHQLGQTELGDRVDVWLPGFNEDHPAKAEVVYIHSEHDRYIARLDPATSEAFRQNFSVDPVLREHSPVGEPVEFTQQAGVPYSVLRHGVIAGRGDESGGLKTLTGADGTLGSSGAPVTDREGHIVGQIVAYDPKQHVNLMSSAEQILDDLRDFRDGVHLEERASPVSYAGAVYPVVRPSNEF